MSVFNYFTKEQRERARNTDLVQLLRNQGEKLKRSGSEFEWRDGSEKVTVRGNLWFNQYDQQGGDAIDFVRRYYNKDYPEAVAFLLNQGGGQIIHSFSAAEKPKVLEPPKPNSDMRRAYAYLILNRCIDREVLNAFIHNKMIYEDEEYHNAVFVGYDTKGKPRHYHKRGTLSASSFKGNVSGSVPEYSFHWHGKSDKLRNKLRRKKNKKQSVKLSAEIGKVLIGESNYTSEMLTTSINIINQSIAEKENQIAEIESKLANQQDDIGKLDFYYDEFRSWADEFDLSTNEERKMIICKLIKQIRLYKGYQFEIDFDSDYKRFINEFTMVK